MHRRATTLTNSLTGRRGEHEPPLQHRREHEQPPDVPVEFNLMACRPSSNHTRNKPSLCFKAGGASWVVLAYTKKCNVP